MSRATALAASLALGVVALAWSPDAAARRSAADSADPKLTDPAFGVYPYARFGLGSGSYPKPNETTFSAAYELGATGVVTLAGDVVGVGLTFARTWQKTKTDAKGDDVSLTFDAWTLEPVVMVAPFPRLFVQAHAGAQLGDVVWLRQGERAIGGRYGAGVTWIAVNYSGGTISLALDVNRTSSSAFRSNEGPAFAATIVSLSVALAFAPDALQVSYRDDDEEPRRRRGRRGR